MESSQPLSTVAQNDTGARSALYRWLAASFAFPTAEFHASVGDGGYWAATGQLLTALPYSFDHALIADLHDKLGSPGAAYDDFCAEYIRLFDVASAGGKPACTLYGGEYGARQRLDVMEELVRFYGFFDLVLSEQDRELPDHLSVELEFLHYLAFRESDALERSADPSSYQRAQADFIERHPGQWLPIVRRKLETQTPLPFFVGLVSLTTDVLQADLGYLRSTLRRPQECITP